MQTWAITDPGNIREQNQDAYAVINFGHERMLLVVCDGMGGAKSGNVASSLAVEVFTEEVRRVQKTGMRREAIDAMLTGALQLANQAVFDQAHLSEEFRGMGTTLVAAYAVKDNITIINVGDSRAYHFSSHGVDLITRDHSIVAFMVERGVLTQEQAKNHPGKNVITRAEYRQKSGRAGQCDGRSGTVLMEEGANPMDQYIGKLLDNRYEILEVIGTGGMAVVYKARCNRLNRLVAIKALKQELSQDEEFRRRFYAESQAVAMLSHPTIVSVYDVAHSDGLDYIVMELIDGITLKQYMEQKGQLNWREALHFATQIAKALEHAHSRGIVHRDIKPHNIMILKDGSVKVADFGIARISSAQNTLTREALGSVHYISPEQAKGAHVDARSDLYSLGVVMYEMLTGRPPFDGDTPVSVAIQHINATPVLPRELNPNIPLGLEQITMHAMTADLNKRYKSATEMLADLEEFRKDPNTTFDFTHRQGGIDMERLLHDPGDLPKSLGVRAASTRANIATGAKLSVLFGKIAEWFADLGSLAFKSTVAKSDLASDVQTSLGKADSALQSAPVTSVNGKTGAVTISVPTVPSTTSLIKGNGSGGLVAATRGSDYIASGNIVKQTLVASESTPTENYAINWVYG